MSSLSRFNFIKSILKIDARNSLKTCYFILRNLSSDSSDSENNASSTKLQTIDNFKCLNRVTLLGRATGSANLATLANVDMAFFTLVTNELRRNRSNELVKRSEFHKIQVFIPRLVEKTKQVVRKGSRVLVEGKINYNTRKTEHGNLYFTNIIAENIVFITGRRNQLGESDVEEIMEEEVKEIEK